MRKIVLEIDGVRHALVKHNKVTCEDCSIKDICKSEVLCQQISGTTDIRLAFIKEEPLRGSYKLTIGEKSYRLTEVPANERSCDSCALSSQCVDVNIGRDVYLCEVINSGPCHARFVEQERRTAHDEIYDK